MRTLFIVSFLQVALVAFNGRNHSQGRYMASFWGSVVIGLLWAVNIKLLAQGGYTNILIAIDVAGGALGSIAGIYLHKRLPHKPPEEW